MSNSNQRHILQLNDDCFYELYKFLPTIDWCSLRETCTRFRTVSDYCFDRQSNKFRLEGTTVSGSSFDLMRVKDVKRLIRIFGHKITKLSINRSDFGEHEDPAQLVPLLDRYCLTMRDLEFVNINLVPATIVQCSRLFSNLHRLVIDQWNDEVAFDCCLARCVALKELKIIHLNNIAGKSLAHHRFKSLESFSMKSCGDFDYGFVKRFLENHCRIERLQFLSPYFLAENITQDIAMALPNLLEFSVQHNLTFKPNVLPVTQIPRLKKFEIDFTWITDDCVNQLFIGLVVANHMEDLNLASFRLNDESIRNLCALKTLKILKLTTTNHLDEKVCKKLATELPALLEVHIIECEDITFNEIKQFVEHLTHLKKIVFNRTDTRPSITMDLFLALVEMRKSKAIKETLFIYLNDDDLVDIKKEFKWNGLSEILIKQSNEIRLLPLEEEHIRTVLEYGCRFMTLMSLKANEGVKA